MDGFQPTLWIKNTRVLTLKDIVKKILKDVKENLCLKLSDLSIKE